jgi:hypothetical protein
MKKGRKPKSRFYHIRLNKVGLNEERAAEVLGVTVDEVRRFDKEGAPVMAERLLLLWDRKHVGHDGWDGWLFSRGVLLHKGKRWTPRMILCCRECDDELRKLQNERERLKTGRGLLWACAGWLRASFMQNSSHRFADIKKTESKASKRFLRFN